MEKQLINGNTDGITLLGNAETDYPNAYCPKLLETITNKHDDIDYMIRFNCPEFTCLCPITGQPDFASIYINYIPGHLMVESKSLKLYLFSFRNHGGFHEDCVNTIVKDLRQLLSPKYIEVLGKFTPRGGISINPYSCWGEPNSKYEELAYYRLKNSDLIS
ncbi:MAG: preQ(1) synthase [Firmicutes bacterium]|nr:preQ(1) synthase [Bacillota bacterium]